MINGAAATDTFQTGDTINGSGATNRVDVTVGNTTAAAPLVAINNVDSVNFRTLAAQTVNAQLFTGVNTVRSTGANNILTVNNGAIASTYALENSVAAAVDGLAVGIRAGDTAGITTTANFSVSNVGTRNTAAVGAANNQTNSAISTTVAGIENINIVTSGTNFFQFTGNAGGATTDNALLTITGSGNNTVTIANGGLATTSTINASTATGPLNLTVGTNLTTGDTITGTAGTTDSLRATVSGTVATGLAVTGIESLRLDSGAAATLGFASLAGFSAVRIDDAAGVATGVRTLINGGGFGALNFVGTGTTAALANAMTFSGITASGGWTGAADSLAITLSNGGVALTSATPYTVGAIVVNGVENVTVAVADAAATATTALGGLTSNTLSTFAVTSNGTVTAGTLDTALANSNSIASVDFSSVTGTTAVSTVTIGGTALNILTAAAAITAGAGGLTVTLNQVEAAGDALTFTGAAGADTLTAATYAGNIVANTGAGRDVITLGANATSQINAGTGGDTITLTAGAAGVDNIGVNNNFGASGQSVVASANTLAGPIAATNTITYATTAAGNVDVLTNFRSGVDHLDVVTAATAATNVVGLAVAATNTLNTTYVAYGSYNAGTGVFTIANTWAGGTPDAIVYVGDGALTAATTTGAVVLVGLNQALVAADFI